MELSPLALFVYNRLDHTRRTVESLLNNALANETTLFVYCDGAKCKEDEHSVEQVRQYISSVSGFKNITVVNRTENFGLARSIVDGVGNVLKGHESLIVLEDDIETSSCFLRYMNEALNMYKEEENVWQVTGYNYPINEVIDESTFFFRGNSCWGWGTWRDRWTSYKKDIKQLEDTFSKEDIYKFDFDGVAEMWKQVQLNKQGKINTWCIFFYATMFLNKGLCLYPKKSLVRNIGHDGSGTHCSTSSEYTEQVLSNEPVIIEKQPVIENKITFNEIRQYFKLKQPGYLKRIIKFFFFK